MLYSALVNSPLGEVLLQANKDGLTGLYFTDQKDCPHQAINNQPATVLSKPSAGLFHGRPLAKFRLKPKTTADSSELATSLVNNGNKTKDLFDSDVVQKELFADFADNIAANNFSQIKLLQQSTDAAAKKILQQAASQLNDYWRGQLTVFDLPLNPQGSDFQKKVWLALIKVELGATSTYGALGAMAGFGPKHGRAIGTAVGSNPISIIIPCHRILASNGTLNGYGGGLLRKAYLLQLEGFKLF